MVSGDEKLAYWERESNSKVIQLDEDDDESFPETMMPASIANISKDRLNHVNADFPYFVVEEGDKKMLAKAYWYLVKRNPLWMGIMPGYEWEKLHPELIDQFEGVA